MANAGIMNDAFFVSKKCLLDWVNQTFDLDLKKVEDCANGAVYCQIIDCCFPGKVRMQKVDFGAKTAYYMERNYKVLQEAFDTCGIPRNIDVAKLVKAKYQDNLEFLQWVKHFCDTTRDPTVEYDARSRRFMKDNQLPDWCEGKVPAKQQENGRSKPARPRVMPRTAAAQRDTRGAALTKDTPHMAPQHAQMASEIQQLSSDVQILSSENTDLQDQKAELVLDNQELQRERDFYYGKLRSLEDMANHLKEVFKEHPDCMSVIQLLDDVEKIIYKEDTEEAPSFAESY